MSVPGPKSIIPFANFYAMATHPLAFLTNTARTYGDVAAFKIAGQQLFLISHPDLIRDVLVTNDRSFMKSRALQRTRIILGDGLLTSEGEPHRRQRRLMAPAFHRERIARYAEIMTANAEKAAGAWRSGDTINIAHEMMRLTLAVVAQALFGSDISGEADEIGAALSELVDNFNVTLAPFMGLVDKLPLPQVKRMRRAIDRLDRTVYGIIAERRATGGDRGDLLSMLLFAQDEEGSGGMTDLQVRDEVMTLLLAGHETTANALSWSCYLLAQHPEFEARLHAEAEESSRPFTLAVFSEAMRLYPPAWIMGRRALEDVTIGGAQLARDNVAILSQYVTHRDPRWWPDPERFDPSRFLEAVERPKFAYFPFGGGGRTCIGEGFAWTEGVLVLAAIAKRWRLRLAQPSPPVPQPRITLRPKGGIRLRVDAR
jgi:cytochrome P450